MVHSEIFSAPYRCTQIGGIIWGHINSRQSHAHMVNRDSLNDLAQKITSLLPENVQQMQQDLESNIHSLLQNTLSQMNLVTREEFDVQAALLQRTREKLEKLEQLLDQLEQKNS